MADEDIPTVDELEAQANEQQLESVLSGEALSDGEEAEGKEDLGSDDALSCGSGPLDSDLAIRSSTGGGGGDNLMDNLSEGSDGGFDTDIDTEEEKEMYDPTGTAAYYKCCEVLGIIPVSHFMRDLQQKESIISLKHHGLGPKGTKAITAALASNTCVTHLDLGDCGLGTEGGVAITTMLKENCYITHLDLSDNNLEAAGALAIANMLESNNTLTHLSLKGNNFNDKAAVSLSDVIRTSFQISYLDLSHNIFGEAGGVLLGDALGESEVLQTLNLSWNHIRRKGAIALANGLKTNQMLKVFDLSHNGLGDEGATALVEALKINTTLTELDISNNRFSSTTAALFATKVLPVSETLKILRIGGNSMQRIITPKEDHSQLSDPLTDIGTLLDAAATCTTLTTLDLSGFTFTIDLADKVTEMRSSRPDLTIIYGGTGGNMKVKPLASPQEKLMKYSTKNNLILEDLFRSFDKEQCGVLSEEQFRQSLQHIQAPLLEFERQKLLKQFGKTAPPTEEGGEETVAIDYQALVEAAKTERQITT